MTCDLSPFEDGYDRLARTKCGMSVFQCGHLDVSGSSMSGFRPPDPLLLLWLALPLCLHLGLQPADHRFVSSELRPPGSTFQHTVLLQDSSPQVFMELWETHQVKVKGKD